MQKRKDIMEMEERIHFSHDIRETFSEQEKEASEIFEKLRKHFKTDDYNTIIHDYFTQKVLICNSYLIRMSLLRASCIPF